MKFVLDDQAGWSVRRAPSEEHSGFELADDLGELVDGSDEERWCVSIDLLVDGPHRKPGAGSSKDALGCG